MNFIKTMTTLAEISLQHPQCWKLDINNRILFDGANQIHLTNIESIIVKNMLLKKERVISKTELISSIGRDPDLYRGLEMSLSRLQIKFKKSTEGRHLFRAVRNRGYCLTQTIHINGEPSREFT
jgi:two-component system OmpR family response regulator